MGVFQLAGDAFEIVIDNNHLFFKELHHHTLTTIEGLQLSYSGVLKEHPDLEDNPEWRSIAIDRLKKKLKEYPTEMSKLLYVKDELTKFGWQPMYFHRAGFREQRF